MVGNKAAGWFRVWVCVSICDKKRPHYLTPFRLLEWAHRAGASEYLSYVSTVTEFDSIESDGRYGTTPWNFARLTACFDAKIRRTPIVVYPWEAREHFYSLSYMCTLFYKELLKFDDSLENIYSWRFGENKGSAFQIFKNNYFLTSHQNFRACTVERFLENTYF